MQYQDQFEKSCNNCGGDFTTSGRTTMYCTKCSALRSKKTVAKGVQRVPCRVHFARFRAFVRHNSELHDLGYHLTQEEAEQAVEEFRKINIKVSQGQFGKDHRTTTNIGYYMRRRSEIRLERRYCNRCEADLKNATQYEWCVHHIDHDRTNNIDENFELLCKRCHQLEHCKHDKDTGQFTQGSTTIPNGSTPKANVGGSGEKCKL